MKYKELIINKIELLDGKLKTLNFLAQQGQDIQAYNNVLEQTSQLLEEIKSLIEKEN